MTVAASRGQDDDPRGRLYDAYVSTHTGGGSAGGADPAIVGHILDHLPTDRTARILDIGCGPGDLVRVLRRRGYAEVHGVDISAEQVALAKQRGITGIEQADLREHLDARRAEFDVILALDVLEHFEKPEVIPLLDLVIAALRPGGRFIARTPNGSSPFMGRYRYGDFTHGLAFTTRSLQQLLQTVGFREVSFAPTNPIAHGVLSSVRLALWKVIAGILKFVLAVETGDVRSHIVTQNLIVDARR